MRHGDRSPRGSERHTCAGCLISPLEVSLVLVCRHRLCLDCAAQRIHWPPGHGDVRAAHTRGQRATVYCPDCLAKTEVDPTAAQHVVDRKRAPPQQEPTGERFSAWPGGLNSRDSTPSRGQQQRQMPVAELCGQCQAVHAVLDCVQCSEQFCAVCAECMHRAGRMKEHTLTPIRRDAGSGSGGSAYRGGSVSGGNRRPASPSAWSNASTRATVSPRHQPVEAMSAGTRMCGVHPGEPLQYFCLDCEHDCICAECAVTGAHRGHQVMNARKAYQHLDAEIGRVLETAQVRSEKQARALQQTEALRRDLSKVIFSGKQQLQLAFKQLRAGVAEKEAQLTAGLDACERSVGQTVISACGSTEDHRAALRETQDALRKLDRAVNAYVATGRSEEVPALNAYAATRQRVDGLADVLATVNCARLRHMLVDLQAQLRASLELQANGIALLGTRVQEIRRCGGDAAAEPRADADASAEAE